MTVAPHSHSIVLRHGNALICQRKFFLCTRKHRARNPSEICALDFKGEFRRSAISSVPATIGIDWSIFSNLLSKRQPGATWKNTVSRSNDKFDMQRDIGRGVQSPGAALYSRVRMSMPLGLSSDLECQQDRALQLVQD
jgi:hypothetical protein